MGSFKLEKIQIMGGKVNLVYFQQVTLYTKSFDGLVFNETESDVLVSWAV